MNELLLALVLNWSVVDGDTIKVQAHVWPGVIVEDRVRLLRLDTPEVHATSQCERDLAAQATAYTKAALTAAKVIVLRGSTRDSFGRVLAEVYVDGANYNDRLLASGLARPFGVKGPWCQ